MSYRERQNRKDSRAKTPEQLHRGRCGICMNKIKPGEPTREVPQGSGRAHEICPDWPDRGAMETGF